MRCAVLSLLIWLGLLCAAGAQPTLPGFPPGVFLSRSAIDAAASPALSMGYTPVTTGQQNVAYTGATPSTSGGTAPYTYSISSGTLPTGLTLNTSTGVITGTPTTVQTQTGLALRVTDNVSATVTSSTFQIAVAFQGIGDLGITNVMFYQSFRCYSNSYAGPVADIFDSATGSTTETSLVCASGVVSAAANGAGANCGSSCSSVATTCAVACEVATMYDQSGQTKCTTACNLTRAHGNRPTYTQSATGKSRPCATFVTGSSQSLNSPNWASTQAQPITIAIYGERTGSVNFMAILGADAGGFQLQNPNVASRYALNAGSVSASVTASDAAFHALVALFSGSSSSLLVDTTTNTGLVANTNGINLGNAVGMASNGNSGNFWNGVVCEMTGWAQSVSTGNQTLINSNLANWY